MLTKKISNLVPITTIVTDENTNCFEQLCHSTINKALNHTDDDEIKIFNYEPSFIVSLLTYSTDCFVFPLFSYK